MATLIKTDGSKLEIQPQRYYKPTQWGYSRNQ